MDILTVSDQAEREQRERMAQLRAPARQRPWWNPRLAALRTAAAADDNLIPAMLDCARAYCTLYEIRAVLERVYGAYREPVFF